MVAYLEQKPKIIPNKEGEPVRIFGAVEGKKVVFIIIDTRAVTSQNREGLWVAGAAMEESEAKGFKGFAIWWLYAGKSALKDQRFS